LTAFVSAPISIVTSGTVAAIPATAHGLVGSAARGPDG